MSVFKKVAIVGIGLIGGSIALELKRKHLAKEVVGVSRRRKSLAWAKEIGAIDKGSLDLAIIKGADLVILATPVGLIINKAPIIAKFISKDCVVTDVGSTKAEIVSKLEKIFPNFLGSHPLAGSEKCSVRNAQLGMFKQSICILTPTKKTTSKALNKIRSLWLKMGTKIIILSPEKHDKVLSFTSHLPHVVAFSLIGAIPTEYLGLASTGLRDTTRIASSEPNLWVDILLSNRKNILKNISIMQKKLSSIKSAIENKDAKALNNILSEAKEKRDCLARV